MARRKKKMVEPVKDEQSRRSSKVFSFRISKRVDEVISPEPQTRSLFIEELVKDLPGTCPLCNLKWPGHETLERVAVRLTKKTHFDLHQFPSAYVRAWVLVELGYCPVCSQPQKK
jgi:hypothetical protein